MLNHQLKKTLKEIENFEATESVARTGTGSRREGHSFEVLIRRMWHEFADFLIIKGAKPTVIRHTKSKAWVRLAKEKRSLILPCSIASTPWKTAENLPSSWLQVEFPVEKMFANFPSLSAMVRKYAPPYGLYAKDKYIELFQGLETEFDDTLIMEEAGTLVEKILFEYKTGKASKHKKIDGNAHERLSFQILQYLEVATQYPRCSFIVLANGAWTRYRNKYHPSFHAQADRLEAFSWFHMKYLSTIPEYETMLSGFAAWLLHPKP